MFRAALLIVLLLAFCNGAALAGKHRYVRQATIKQHASRVDSTNYQPPNTAGSTRSDDVGSPVFLIFPVAILLAILAEAIIPFIIVLVIIAIIVIGGLTALLATGAAATIITRSYRQGLKWLLLGLGTLVGGIFGAITGASINGYHGMKRLAMYATVGGGIFALLGFPSALLLYFIIGRIIKLQSGRRVSRPF